MTIISLRTLFAPSDELRDKKVQSMFNVIKLEAYKGIFLGTLEGKGPFGCTRRKCSVKILLYLTYSEQGT